MENYSNTLRYRADYLITVDLQSDRKQKWIPTLQMQKAQLCRGENAIVWNEIA